jgi:CBS domain-containing protein/gamma-glutamyl:cysteine ligase YbdK (ATP-grasp superfamily)
MNESNVIKLLNSKIRSRYIWHLLNDIKALEIMLKENLIESDVHRIGAEQEFCLVNSNWRPAKNSDDILADINDSHFTTELSRYNLELNLDPEVLNADGFSKVESQIRTLLAKAEQIASKYDTKILLTGILPTISKKELELDYMTASPRYWRLNEVMKELRGDDFNLHIRGVDELTIRHDSVLFEACNTSFQIHLQIAPDDFISSFNWAQAISGPVLGISTNSPLLLGRELWSETRIALFQQSIDTRNSSYALKDQQSRVSFGMQWAHGSVAEIFKNDIVRHNVLIAKENLKDSVQELSEGRMPKLEALSLYNSTIYRWNRPCFGVANNIAHVRIENRYLPAGPSVLDQMANFAFWIGLMMGRPSEFDHMESVMDFRDAKANFIKAARTGKETVMMWKGKLINLQDLIKNELLPIAYEGLKKIKIDEQDINRYLQIIEQRNSGNNGSEWITKNYRELRIEMKQDDALLSLTEAIYQNQHSSQPVHDWPMSKVSPKIHATAHLVKHIMSTQLYVVNENDLAQLATSLMLWKGVHHVPVENDKKQLVGLLTWTHMKNFKEEEDLNSLKTVSDIMAKSVQTVDTDTEIKEALSIMKKNMFGCLPVIQNQHLVGIVTLQDILPFDHD